MFFSNKTSLGLDISDSTIEAVELLLVGKKNTVKNFGRISLESGIVDRGRIIDEDKLAQALDTLFSSAKPNPIINRQIRFALPDCQSFVHTFILPDNYNKNDLDSIIQHEIESAVPIEKEDIVFSFCISQFAGDKKQIITVSADKKVVWEWKKFFIKHNFVVDYFDTESLALYRGLKKDLVFGKNICLVDLGANNTMISVFGQYGQIASFSCPVAGNTMTEAISTQLNLSVIEAEDFKIKKGLIDDVKVGNILKIELDKIIFEIKAMINYFKNETGLDLDIIILAGGSSQLLGLVDYFSEKLNLPISLAQLDIVGAKKLEYIEANGLAVYGLDKKWSVSDPVINLKFIEKISVDDVNNAKALPQDGDITEQIDNLEELESNSNSNSDHLHHQIMMLVTILILGAVLLVLAFVFR